MRQVLRYPGAKSRIADWIIGQMPKHDVYLELFGGSLAILMSKGRCHTETVNDIDNNIINFFRILRAYPEILQEKIRLTPFAREEYKAAYGETEGDLERARRYCVKCWQGFGNSQLYKNGFKSGQQAHSPNPAEAWAKLPEFILEAAERLRGVQIENLPALELLRRYDTKDVFIYADPPYLPNTRKSHLYKHEMTEREHIELLIALKKHPGKVMISGYDNELYNELLKGWEKAQIKTRAECGASRTEVVWMNYKKIQMSLFDIQGL